MDSPVTVNLLGSVEIRRAGQLLRTGGGRMTVVLAMLALSVGRPVGASALIEAVWDSHLPQSAAGSLQNHVLRLRRMLGADAIRTTPAGYLLDLEPDQVDLWRFRRLATEAAATAARDPQAARGLLVEALALWRGEPLDDPSRGSSRNATKERAAERARYQLSDVMAPR
jgi:SARP family transcriptional regulator, regulator of embCAB operon